MIERARDALRQTARNSTYIEPCLFLCIARSINASLKVVVVLITIEKANCINYRLDKGGAVRWSKAAV